VSFEGRVAVKGAKQTMDALKQFDPDAEKAIRKRINKAARSIVLSARSGMASGKALRKWGSWTQGGRDLSYNGNNQKIRTTRANMRKRGQIISNYIGVVNPTPGGAIFELAGRKSPDPGFHAALLMKGYGLSRRQNTNRPGVFKAFDDNEGAAARDIEDALKEAEQRLSSILRGMAGGV
jgi:hypothetical protein